MVKALKYDSTFNCYIQGKHKQHAEIVNGSPISVIEFKNGITVRLPKQQQHAVLCAKDYTKPKMQCYGINNAIITGSKKKDLIDMYECLNNKIDLLNDSTKNTGDVLRFYNEENTNGCNIVSFGRGDIVHLNTVDKNGKIVSGAVKTSPKK